MEKQQLVTVEYLMNRNSIPQLLLIKYLSHVGQISFLIMLLQNRGHAGLKKVKELLSMKLKSFVVVAVLITSKL